MMVPITCVRTLQCQQLVQQLLLLLVSDSLHLSIYSYIEEVQRLAVKVTDKYRSPAKEPVKHQRVWPMEIQTSV